MVEGKIEALTVTTFAEQSLAQLAYSYLVDGERYSGYFTRQFADEQDAWDYVFVHLRAANIRAPQTEQSCGS